jgi:nitroimidazol reductase NimA-like FMN-containing flavoprotein (pyridoxamine 5'-phosphate oxidase superfamily)
MSSPNTPPTPRTRVRRVAQRGRYDAETIHDILDATWMCHVAFKDETSVHCIPTACWRIGDALYIHGSNGSRMLKALSGDSQACVAITHLDGLVLARSAFNHSMNYRSAVVYGQFEVVPDEDKVAVLDQFMMRIAPERVHEARPGDANELASTTVLRLSLAEASAKTRRGGPKDDEADLPRPVWAGELPFRTVPAPAVREKSCQIEPPEYVRSWAAKPPGDVMP